jgi:NADPH:quinone reductase-like Zn-dependent oxidoreductase
MMNASKNQMQPSMYIHIHPSVTWELDVIKYLAKLGCGVLFL